MLGSAAPLLFFGVVLLLTHFLFGRWCLSPSFFGSGAAFHSYFFGLALLVAILLEVVLILRLSSCGRCCLLRSPLGGAVSPLFGSLLSCCV